jgi:hypothetical protein
MGGSGEAVINVDTNRISDSYQLASWRIRLSLWRPPPIVRPVALTALAEGAEHLQNGACEGEPGVRPTRLDTQSNATCQR